MQTAQHDKTAQLILRGIQQVMSANPRPWYGWAAVAGVVSAHNEELGRAMSDFDEHMLELRHERENRKLQRR